MTELDVDFGARLSLSVDGLASEIRAGRDRERRMAAGVAYIARITASTAVLPAATPADSFAPRAGYAWAVQALRVTNLGAATDYVQVFRGKSLTDVASLAPAVNTFNPGAAAPYACPPWHPGRTGLILKAGDGLQLAGTVTGIGPAAPLIIEMDVIQVEVALLPYLLL